jgi:hypothetical protein
MRLLKTLMRSMAICRRDQQPPIFLTFADAADNLGGAFSFHFEASGS